MQSCMPKTRCLLLNTLIFETISLSILVPLTMSIRFDVGIMLFTIVLHLPY